jgi:hypothetical protein
MTIFFPFFFSLCSLCCQSEAPRAQLPEPKAFFGFQPGTDGKLFSFEKSHSYFQELARLSPRLHLEILGKTSEGRPLSMALISSKTNLENLSIVLRDMAGVADPRKLQNKDEERILAESPVVVFISMSMHAIEVGGSQYAPVFAYELLTRKDSTAKSIRDNLVIALLPSTNPDGMTMIRDWFEKRKNEKQPKLPGSEKQEKKLRAPLPYLYQKYGGHDNNRDWFQLNLQETRLITRQLYHRLHPLVLLDMHQMGGKGPRFFVPPYADPVNPNLDPILTQALNLLGTRIAHDMTLQGLKGVVTGTTFDNWWNGGNRNVPFRHNILGILTECSSANLGDPIMVTKKGLRGMGVRLPQYRAQENFPDPWKGGRWGLPEIFRYDRAAAWSLLRHVSRNRREFLSRKLLLGRRAIEAGEKQEPAGFAILSTPGREAATRRLVALLQALGIEVHALLAPIHISKTQMVPPGSWYVPCSQPFRSMLKDLLEPQAYPKILDAPRGRPIRPYDAAGWTLPLQYRVPCFAISQKASPKSLLAPSLDLQTDPISFLDRNKNSGSFGDHANLARAIQLLQKRKPVSLKGKTLHFGIGPKDSRHLVLLKAGLFGLWADGRSSTMDAGWTRLVLDRHHVSYQPIPRNLPPEALKTALSQIQVLLLPSMSKSRLFHGIPAERQLLQFAGGIGLQGYKIIREFVQKGGRVLTWGRGVDAVLPLKGKDVKNLLQTKQGRDFFAPGSLLQVFVEPNSSGLFGRGFENRFPVYQRDRVALGGRDLVPLLSFTKKPLLSGYLEGKKYIEGKAAMGVVHDGKGEWVLMSFRPQNRGQTLGTIPLILQGLLKTR